MHQRISLKSENNSLIYITKTELNKDFKTNFHSHPNLEILLIISGNGYIQTTNRKINIFQHDLIIINRNCKHCEISDNLVFFAIGINKANIFLKEKFIKKIIYYSLDNTSYQKMFSLYQLIFMEGVSTQDGYLSIIDNALKSIITLIKRHNDLIYNTSTNDKESDLISNVKSIIQHNYHLNFKLDDISSSLSISKSKLCHQFKKEVGLSIIEYKLQYQLEEAKNLLISTDMNISEISSFVGFNGTSYFTEIFKQKFHLTPSEFRKINKKI